MKDSDVQEDKCIRVAFSLIVLVIIFTLLVGFFVSFYYRDFHKARGIFRSGLLAAPLMALTIIAFSGITRLLSVFKRKNTGVYVLSLPCIIFTSALAAELFILKTGGTRYSWVLGMTITSLFIGLLIEAHDEIRELITSSVSNLEGLYRQIILSLNTSLEAIEPYNIGHNERVAWYSRELCARLGLDRDEQQRIARAALLHDLGKIGVSEKILSKDGSLTIEEWESIKRHPHITEMILEPLKGFSQEIDFIKSHHERIDGNGYHRTPAAEIPAGSRVIAVADAFDAMTTDRPYRPALPVDKAIIELSAGAGGQFDQKVVDCLLDFLAAAGDFSKPDHIQIRKDMSLLEPVKEVAIEADCIETIRQTTRRLTLLEKFYQIMGAKKYYLARHAFNCLGTGLIFGALMGLAIFSISKAPIQLLSFSLQGLLAGFILFLINIPLKPGAKTDHKKNKSFITRLWEALPFFPAGLLAGFCSLEFIFLRFSTKAPGGFDFWNVSYLVIFGLLTVSVRYFTSVLHETSATLLVSIEELQKLYFQLIYSMAFALEAKDIYTRGHSERVAKYSLLIGKKLKLEHRQLEDLQFAALFHDIGKIGVPLAILHKKGSLEKEEMDKIKKHPGLGGEIIKTLGVFSNFGQIVRHHHERMDGSGYPDGLKGEKIPLLSRIIAVADVFDALVSDRPYRNGMTREAAIGIIKQESGEKLDPKIVEIFLEQLDELDDKEMERTSIYPDLAESAAV